ncbi:phytanoyl-CoA dioxygenase family protein [Pseudomonas aeruginosa]|uniref:phytanoyl-CoA dioxygenase family protein n=1 Tax=Pseudomonas aeruginosa TaxID=287 RepID=UPI00077242E6|nr:phytanoyl-CoA dioxygenase family protein [Pseudomonas aeruginosa]KXC50008.1 phytanoyl-CoA dioxygenase [Pseudomonas aeruginosa]
MSTRRLTTVSCDTPIEQVVEIIRRDGAVAICNFVSEETLKSLTEDLDSYLGVTPCGMDPYFAGTQTRRTARILAKSDSAVEVALNPLFLETAKQALQTPTHVWVGNDRVEITPDIQLSMTQAIQIGPGQGLQPLHRDDATSLWRHPQYGREARLQLMLAITDFTEENGATRVIPGSHQWDDERMPTQEETIGAEMKAGTALLWLGSVYHGGGANRSDAPRTGLTMAYDLAFLRLEENHFLSIPVERVRQLPSQMQRLLGWSASSTLLGWVEIDGQMRDPQELLGMPSFSEAGKGF